MSVKNRIPINPGLLIWARERAGLDPFVLEIKFPKLSAWENGSAEPTLRQLEGFARAVHVPFGYLFLPEPPEETLPIPDYRTCADRKVNRPSPNLLDTLYLCQQRQDWYREYALSNSLSPVDYIGSSTMKDDPLKAAKIIRERLGFSLQERKQLSGWTEALRQFIDQVEETGVLVMASSIVGSNSHRKLDVEEFRGFVLADDLAPLVFLNAADSKAAQMFTVVHELAHLWLGESGISDTEAGRVPEQATERWCNEVAAELLMPKNATREFYNPDTPVEEEIQHLAQIFKVSTLVALRRLYDTGLIDKSTLWRHYRRETERVRSLESGSAGGDFYRTLGTRTGKCFSRAVITSALEGQTLFKDAFRFLGIRRSATFFEAARRLEVKA